MSLVIPDAFEVETLQWILNRNLTIRLYSNNYTPVGGSAAANFTEVIGGGYANLPLTFAHWGFTAGDPSIALYDASQVWTFTGPTNAPGTIYGVYITRDSDGHLMWAERFAAGFLPFSPIAGSIIRYLPRYTGQTA